MKRSPLRRTSWLKRGPSQLKRSPLKRGSGVLESLGIDYPTYLKSALWKRIRFRIMSRDGFKCLVCKSAKGLTVHHRSYRIEVMAGRADDRLATLCGRCHLRVEFRVFVKSGSRENVRRGPKERERVLVEMLREAA